jgi:hypothetical protein
VCPFAMPGLERSLKEPIVIHPTRSYTSSEMSNDGDPVGWGCGLIHARFFAHPTEIFGGELCLVGVFNLVDRRDANTGGGDPGMGRWTGQLDAPEVWEPTS